MDTCSEEGMEIMCMAILGLQTISVWMVLQGLWYRFTLGKDEGDAKSQRVWKFMTFR